MAGNSKAKRHKLLRLHAEQHGLCKWCEKPCHLPGFAGYWRVNGNLGGKAATLDHVYHKRDPRRQGPGGNATVMACFTCNKQRGLEYERKWRQTHGKPAGVPA